jgi:hypothetical protein
MLLSNPQPQKVTAISVVNQPLVDQYADLFYQWALLSNQGKYDQASTIQAQLKKVGNQLPKREFNNLVNTL